MVGTLNGAFEGSVVGTGAISSGGIDTGAWLSVGTVSGAKRMSFRSENSSVSGSFLSFSTNEATAISSLKGAETT